MRGINKQSSVFIQVHPENTVGYYLRLSNQIHSRILNNMSDY